MKVLVLWLLCAGLAWLGIGCLLASRPARVLPDHPAIRYVGWFDMRAPHAPRCAWPGSQIVARFTGTSLKVELTDTPFDDTPRETDWVTVMIDDLPPKVFALAEGRHAYRLADGLLHGEHAVTVWKRTEPAMGTITFHGFLLDQGARLVALPAREKRRAIFIGDSITAGFGNEGADPQCHGTAGRENNYETYGAIAARTLHAEYVAMACSGKGLSRNYLAEDALTMPVLSERTIPTEEDSPAAETKPADVVVVNLGTNDFVLGTPDAQTFVRACAALVTRLRERHPRALLVLVLGPMLADDFPQPQSRSLMRSWLQTVVSERQAKDDSLIELVELWSKPDEGAGCDFHPNVKAHARMGRELAERIRARLDW